MIDLPEITAVQRLTIRPDDRILVKVDGQLSRAQREQISRSVKAALRLADQPVVVIGAGMDIAVLGPATGTVPPPPE